MCKDKYISTKQLIGLMIVAYAFSFMIRLIWVLQFQDNPNFFWNGQLMINTNDGYFFASGAQKALFGIWAACGQSPDFWYLGLWGDLLYDTFCQDHTIFSGDDHTLYACCDLLSGGDPYHSDR